MITAVSEITDNTISEESVVEIATDVSGTVNYLHEADEVVAVDSDTVIKNKVFDSYNLVNYIGALFKSFATINYCYLVKYSDGGLRLHMDFTWTSDESTFTDVEDFQILSSSYISNSTDTTLQQYAPVTYFMYGDTDDLCRLHLNSSGLYIRFNMKVFYANTANAYAIMVDIPDTATLGSSLPDPTTTILDSGTTGYDLEYDFTYPALMSMIGDIYTSDDDLRDYFNVVVRAQTYNPNLLDITFRWRTGTINASYFSNYVLIPSMYIQNLGLSNAFGRASIISSYCGTEETETLGDCSAGMLEYDTEYGLRFIPYINRSAGEFIYGHFRLYLPDSASWDILWNDSLVNLYTDEEMLKLYRYPLTQTLMSKRPLNGFKLYYQAKPNIYLEQKADGVLCHVNTVDDDSLTLPLPIYSLAGCRDFENSFIPFLFGYLGTEACYIQYDVQSMPINIGEVIVLGAEPSEAETDAWTFELRTYDNINVCQDVFIPTAVISQLFNSSDWVPYITYNYDNELAQPVIING